MRMSRTIAAIFLTMAIFCGASAQGQNQQALAQDVYSKLPTCLQAIQTYAQTTASLASSAQAAGAYQQVQLCQQEAQMHQAMYNAILGAQQNPNQLLNPAYREQLRAALEEYWYRADNRDMRPYEQIRPQIEQYAALQKWRATTPEGQAAQRSNFNQQSQFARQRSADLRNQAQTDDYVQGRMQQATQSRMQTADMVNDHNTHAINGELQ